MSSCASRPLKLNVDTIHLSNTLKDVKQNNLNNNSIKALARVSISTKTDKIFFDQVTIAKKTDYLRLEAMAAFGTVVAQVLSDGDKVYFITKEEKIVFEDAKDFNFSSIYPNLPEELKVDNLVNVLLANPPFNIWEDKFKVEFDGNNSNLILVFDRIDNLRIWVNTKIRVIEKINYLLTNGDVAEIIFSDFKYCDSDIYFPKNILLKTSDYNLGIIYNDDLKINDTLNISVFKPNI
ncbi:MAG: DUF4292 domain-containing protein [Candidatus Dadabacteria bacterium]|nr:DUF4292 domain-containing protein [Candidatus Dadabacteria bacterium]